jgi:hypothetical protein
LVQYAVNWFTGREHTGSLPALQEKHGT